MKDQLYVVKYSGPFGFIKPWTAVRDSETFSQQFLTPSIIEGIEKKLFPELLSENGSIKKIVRHKLNYNNVSLQQEQTQTRGWEYKKREGLMIRSKAILTRGVIIEPILLLAFNSQEDAEIAAKQHICLCRNEDVLTPNKLIQEISTIEFDKMPGFELRFGKTEESFLVGYNRFDNNKPMYGWIEIEGKCLIMQ